MSSAHPDAVLHQIRRLFGPGTVSGLSEWQLLDRYTTQRDEAAFEALVTRHGPMVLGVCQRVLTDPHDVEDAFQATFLVLIKKAGTLAERDAIGHWLYGVAHRVALKSRSLTVRQRAALGLIDAPRRSTTLDPARRELGALIDEELRRLPAKYRAPVVLCYLEGRTHEEAALQLQWPLGTVKGRLSRARTILKQRLTRRGIGLPAAVLATALGDSLAAAVPEPLVRSTLANALRLTTGTGALGALPATLALLVQGVLTTMTFTKLKMVSAAGFVLLTLGAGVIAQQSTAGDRAGGAGPIAAGTVTPPTAAPRTALGQVPPPAAPEVPDAILEREHDQRALAADIFKNESRAYFQTGAGDLKELARWSQCALDASDRAPAERLTALEEHLARMKSIEQAARRHSGNGRAGSNDVLLARFYRQEAQLMLDRARAGLDAPAPAAAPAASTGAAVEHGASDESIRRRLEEPVAMRFDKTPLAEFLKNIRSETARASGKAIPIYVDPGDLAAAEQTMESPITIELEGVPLKTTLTLALQQLGLIYNIKDGVLLITRQDSANPQTPIREMVEKIERGEFEDVDIVKLTKMLTTLNEIRKLRLDGEKMNAEIEKLSGANGRFQ